MFDLIVSNWIFRIGALVLIFGLVVLVGIIVANFAINRFSVLRELRAMNAPEASVTHQGLTSHQKQSAWSRLVERIEKGGLNLGDTRDSEITKLLQSAGYRSPAAPRIYTLVRLLLIFILPGIYLTITMLSSEPVSIARLYIVCALLAVLGIFIPNLFVRYRAHQRRTAIVNGFPDSLDLMLVCVEAGLGLEAALDRVSREMAVSHPLISSMFAETVLLMRAGASRDDALRKLAQTSGVDEIGSFTTLLIQSDKLGTSIATTLRVYSGEMREARRMRAEEKAHRLPVLISIPLVVFMLPTMIGVLALPAIIMALRDVIPALTGG